MKLLYDEIIRRFPEVLPHLFEGDEDLPYVLMIAVADWLKALTPSDLTPELVRRVADFSNWCKDQPRGETAEDDLFTIWAVGFVEHLFDSDVTRRLLPHVLDKEALIDDPEYWKQWVTPEHYQAALEQY